MLNHIFLITGFVIVICISSANAEICSGLSSTVSGRSYLYLSLEKAPTIKFYSNSKLIGSPSISLNANGLFIDDNKECHWLDRTFDLSRSHSMILQGCNISEIPIKSGWGDCGVGTAILCIEGERYSKSVGKILYKNNNYYFHVSSHSSWEVVEKECSVGC